MQIIFLNIRPAICGQCFRFLQCWPFHEKVITELGIKVILCFGKNAGNFVRRKMEADKLIDDSEERNNRKWRSKANENDKGQIVIVATHPSRADWTNPDSDPSELVKSHLS